MKLHIAALVFLGPPGSKRSVQSEVLGTPVLSFGFEQGLHDSRRATHPPVTTFFTSQNAV